MDLLIMIIITAVSMFGFVGWMLWSSERHNKHPQKH